MRAYVFTDPTLTRHAGRFVWLEIDNEKATNAPLRKRFAIEALPTFFVVDPADEQVVGRWVGGATISQLQAWLDQAGAEVEARALEQSQLPSDQALARADRLYGAGKNAEAAAAYREALLQAPPDWPHYARAVEASLFALSRADDNLEAALLAREAFLNLRQSPSAVNVAVSGLDAALSLPDSVAARKELVIAMEAAVRQVVEDTTLKVAADDRSGAFISLLDARKDAKDDEGARRVAGEWAAFLEGAAARAKSPEQRTVFDSHRLTAYIELGQPERAVPMLERSARDLPDDYNPPARLALAYRAMKRWDDALAASDRALAKAYGPRKLVVLQARAEIYVGRGDKPLARKTLEDALASAQALPSEQRSAGTIAAIHKRLEALR